MDSLCEACLKPNVNPDGTNNNQYVQYVTRDLAKIVDFVVPSGREGLPNLISTKQVRCRLHSSLVYDGLQILESWRNKRVIDPQIVDEVVSSLSARQASAVAAPETPQPEPVPKSQKPKHHTKSSASLARNEIIKRIEEDRERHKRLRERRWVQPVSHNMNPTPLPLSFMPLTDKSDREYDLELSADVEFENEWETLSDWNEDDDEACKEENELCFPNGLGASSMDLSP